MNIYSGGRWNIGSGYGLRSPGSGGLWTRSHGAEADAAVTTGDLQARPQRLADDAGVGTLDMLDRGSGDERRETDVDPPRQGLIRGWSRW